MPLTMQACTVSLNSSLVLSSSSPRSRHTIVVCRMISSKHCEYSSRRTWVDTM